MGRTACIEDEDHLQVIHHRPAVFMVLHIPRRIESRIQAAEVKSNPTHKETTFGGCIAMAIAVGHSVVVVVLTEEKLFVERHTVENGHHIWWGINTGMHVARVEQEASRPTMHGAVRPNVPGRDLIVLIRHQFATTILAAAIVFTFVVTRDPLLFYPILFIVFKSTKTI